jgi:hypothetical protein
MNGRKRERDEDRKREVRPDERTDMPSAPKTRAPEPLDEQSLDEVMRECPL